MGATGASGSPVRRLLGLAWRYRTGCVLMLLCNVLVQIAAVAGLKVLGIGIDSVRAEVDPDSAVVLPDWLLWLRGWLDASPMEVVVLLAGVTLLIAVLGAACKYAATVVQAHVMQNKVVVDLRRAVYDKLQRLSFRFFDANETGSIINRVTTDVQGTREFLDTVVLQSLTLVISLAIYVVAMLQLHVPLTLACLATTPLLYWLSRRFGRTVKPAYRESRELGDDVVRALSENVQGVHVVKGFARQNDQRAGFRAATERLRSQRQWIFWRVTIFSPLIQILTQINMVVLLGYGGYLVMTGQLALGNGFVVFAGLLQAFSSQISNIANITNSIQNSMSGAQRVFEILDAPLEVENRPDAQSLDRPRGHVVFEDVHFGYESEEEILHGISFQAEPGQCIAILGATGAGKSSLLSLIPRFYDPTGGRILLDGVDLRDLDLDQLRSRVGMVFQESFLFSTSIADNIAFGHPDASRAEVERAARLAAAHHFIAQLPDGYDTVIGERGADLSGGQRQRLAIARALLQDPVILILDDATASVDPETEHEILGAMESAMAGRTTFVIAHRLSTLRQADMVLVLEDGHIVERGDHDALMASEGRYRTAADLQRPKRESVRLLKAQREHER